MPISEAIPAQNFELIRDRIAVILGAEFVSQKAITTNVLYDATIWVERFISFDKNELPAIKVYFDNSSFDKDSPYASKGESKYIIAISVNNPNTSTKRGDKQSSVDAQKIAGAIRYIFEHTIYKTLSFSTGFIEGIEITDIITSVPITGDSLHTYTCNLVLNVRHTETNGLEVPTQAVEQINSIVKLEETEKGYLIVKT